MKLEDHHMHTIPHYLACELLETHAYGVQILTAVTAHTTDSLLITEIHRKSKELRLMNTRVITLEGNITGFTIHSSNNYVLTTTDEGLIVVHALTSGEMVGLIEIDASAKGCFQDPSGLYVGTVVAAEDGRYTRLQMYELGTGNKATEMNKLHS